MNISFKGYDATPLKSLYIERATSEPIKSEMQEIADKEGFSLRMATDYLKWAQDDKNIIERNGNPHLVGNLRIDECFMQDLKQTYGLSSSYAKTFVTGGNSFFGKYPNGDKWLLIGEDEIRKNKTKSDVAREYGIEEKNIFTIPQQYYHLDMFMRPIGYPYVLVDSPELVKNKISKMPFLKSPYEHTTLRDNFNTYERKRNAIGYASSKETVKALKEVGFIPIEVAGVFGNGINFMNAIVNKHPDGSISYITNSTSCESPFLSEIEKEFEKELREKVPNIKDVYFVKGRDAKTLSAPNYMMGNIQHHGGGIHCMSLEEPNFEMWV